MRALRFVAAVFPFALAAACSLVVDASTSQCQTDSDCYGRGGDFASSICMVGRCVAPDAGAPDAGLCTTNLECATKLAAPALCRKSDHKCTRILSPECQIIKGDSTDDNAIFLGELSAVTGGNGPSGIARTNSGDLALNEIQMFVGGIAATPGGTPRPLVVVECDDNISDDIPAAHLVTDLEVPAIVGVASSSRVIDVAQNVTIPAGVLLISPAATSADISSLRDQNLVWRTAPSDDLQAVALNDQLPAVEAKYRTDNALAATAKVRLDIVYVDEAYGGGLYDAVTLGGKLNGKLINDSSNSGLVTPLTYEQLPLPIDLTKQVAHILMQDPRPNIIVGFGSTEIITELVTPLEAQWGTASPRPLYLFSDAVQKTELLTLAAGSDDLRKRIRGTVPGTPTSPNFTLFLGKYQSTYGSPVPSVFGMAGQYDSMFLLGYLIAAAADRPLTGQELQKGFARLVTGNTINVGGQNMLNGILALESPGMFNFDGASGPLDFDLTTGDALSNIDVWCINKGGATGSPAFTPSKRYYDASTSAMTGTYDTTACQGLPAD